MENKHLGVVAQVMGPVVDVRFDDGAMPPIHNALTVPIGDRTLTVELRSILATTPFAASQWLRPTV